MVACSVVSCLCGGKPLRAGEFEVREAEPLKETALDCEDHPEWGPAKIGEFLESRNEAKASCQKGNAALKQAVKEAEKNLDYLIAHPDKNKDVKTNVREAEKKYTDAQKKWLEADFTCGRCLYRLEKSATRLRADGACLVDEKVIQAHPGQFDMVRKELMTPPSYAARWQPRSGFPDMLGFVLVNEQGAREEKQEFDPAALPERFLSFVAVRLSSPIGPMAVTYFVENRPGFSSRKKAKDSFKLSFSAVEDLRDKPAPIALVETHADRSQAVLTELRVKQVKGAWCLYRDGYLRYIMEGSAPRKGAWHTRESKEILERTLHALRTRWETVNEKPLSEQSQ